MIYFFKRIRKRIRQAWLNLKEILLLAAISISLERYRRHKRKKKE